MARRLAWALAIAGLVATAGLARASLERHGAGDVPAGLLYLPEGPYLRALALGHEETLADLLYVWAIQYYSTYDDATRYDYLDQVFRGAITELDPQFAEPYLVGGMIMSVEARERGLAMRLYDKGLEAMPDNWEIAYWAGWESYFAGSYADARDYWLRGAQMEGAPQWFWRLAAKMLERSGDIESAIAEYRALAETTTDEKTAQLAKMWLERAENEVAMDVLDKALRRYRGKRGACPEELSELVESGELAVLPQPSDGGSFVLDRSACRVLPKPGESFGGGR